MVQQIYNEDCLAGMRNLPDNSVDCIITSPPYWGLRHYETDPQVWGGSEHCEHVWEEAIAAGSMKNRPTVHVCKVCKAYLGELGLEPTKDMYIEHLCSVFDEAYRVLKSTGTCFINLGDSYYNGYGKGGVLKKSLLLMPERLAIAMCDRKWILRNNIIWHKPNQMPCACTDRFIKDYENILFFSKSKKYFFEKQTEESVADWAKKQSDGKVIQRTKREVWSINTVGNTNGHFAKYPEEIVQIPLDAGCPAYICEKCGSPKKKVYEKIGEFQRRWSTKNEDGSPYSNHGSMQNIYEESGYKETCSCDVGFVPGLVLDPFMGSGTTALVAKKNNRQFIGFELNKDYTNNAKQRLEDKND